MTGQKEGNSSGDGWAPHPEDLEVWEQWANPQFIPGTCAAFREIYPYVNDVKDAQWMARDPHNQQEIAYLVTLIVKGRYRIPDSPFDPDIIENEC